MRTIYLGKKDECPSCGGPKVIYPVGKTVGGDFLYACKDPFHVRTIRQSEVGE